MASNRKKTRPRQHKAKSSQIRYDPKTCTYTVPDSEQRHLQGKYPYDDIQAAIIQAGKHTKRYSDNARQTIQADPCRALEFDLECWLFRPVPQQQARTLSELTDQIRLCPTFVREALTGEIDAELAGRDLAKFYPSYYELGGTGFQPTYNAAVDLVCLLESSGVEKRLPRLQEIDVKILKHLNTAEFAKKLSDLETELNAPRETVGKSLRYLRELGLICHPKSRTDGDTISTSGRNFIKTL